MTTYDGIEELSKSFQPMMAKSRSFDTKRRILEFRRKQQTKDGSPWNCVSPMTQHVLLAPTSPTRIRRSRSRSFNDYIDHQQENRLVPPDQNWNQNHLILPGLTESGTESDELIPSKRNCSHHHHEDSSFPDTSGRKKNEADSFWICAMYGMINATIVLPVLMSFGSIIYRNEAFAPYMPVLIKLTLVSGVVHQICFSTLSSLPFAVGQVQDAGLIFLSAMASDMVEYCQRNEHDDDTLLATVTIGLATATTILGVGMVIIGKLQLAGYVQMLPTCVVGGYLAFIG